MLPSFWEILPEIMNLILEISVVAIVIGVVVNRATRNYLYSNECTINDYLLPNGYYYKLIDNNSVSYLVTLD